MTDRNRCIRRRYLVLESDAAGTFDLIKREKLYEVSSSE